MSTMPRGHDKSNHKEFVKKFCETGMHEGTDQLFQAFYASDWTTLENSSMKYESNCYRIGAIEIVGKLIKLRLQLQEKPIDRNIIERTLNGILDTSLKVQQLLFKQLQDTDYPVQLADVRRVTRPVDPNALDRRDWFYSNCNLQ